MLPLQRFSGVILALVFAGPLRAQAPEALWYSTDSETSVQSFLANADRISVVAPQSFSMDSLGVSDTRPVRYESTEIDPS